MTITMDPPTAPPAAPPIDPPKFFGGGGSENHEPEWEPTAKGAPVAKIVLGILFALLVFILIAAGLSGHAPVPADWIPLT